MREMTLKSSRVIHLKQGVDEIPIQDYVGRDTYYKHTDPCNLTLTGSNGSKVQVPSRQLMNIISIWGIQHNFSGLFVLTSYTEKYPYTYDVKIIEQQFTIEYDCNSRKILKEVNDLEKVIKAGRKLANISEYEGLSGVPMQLLLTAAMCNNADKTVSLLRKYHTAGIIRTIQSPFFRHIYKLIHPTTTFIRTPTRQALREAKKLEAAKNKN